MIVALTGGAFAASGALTAKQKKEVKAIAKQFAGKPGAQGPQGTAGAVGANGEKGDLGKRGKGTDGAAGKNVEVTPTDAGNVVECEENGGAPRRKRRRPVGRRSLQWRKRRKKAIRGRKERSATRCYRERNMDSRSNDPNQLSIYSTLNHRLQAL